MRNNFELKSSFATNIAGTIFLNAFEFLTLKYVFIPHYERIMQAKHIHKDSF